MNRRPVAGAVLAVLSLALAGVGAACSGDDAGTAVPTLVTAGVAGSVAPTGPAASGGSATVAAAEPGAPGAPATSAATGPSVTGDGADPAGAGSDTPPGAGTAGGATATAGAPTTAPIVTTPPVTGVPGASSTSPLCQDYAQVVGTQSVLTIAGAFGGLDDAALARLELIGAPAVVAAAGALAGEWPAELASEQSVVIDAVVQPIASRAQRALDALAARGVDTAPLTAAWTAALAAYDPGQPAVQVAGLPADVDAALAQTATAYAADAVRYDLDPSVQRTEPTPLTTDYLFQHCPELGYLIAGDAD